MLRIGTLFVAIPLFALFPSMANSKCWSMNSIAPLYCVKISIKRAIDPGKCLFKVSFVEFDLIDAHKQDLQMIRSDVYDVLASLKAKHCKDALTGKVSDRIFLQKRCNDVVGRDILTWDFDELEKKDGAEFRCR